MAAGEWVNHIVCMSNIVGLAAVRAARTWPQLLLATAAVLASGLMHLSERKHGLPGVAPFGRWPRAFLWLDRVVAYLSTAYVGYHLFWNDMPLPIVTALVGCVALLLSERVEGGHVWFAVTHSLWHLCAYRILASAFDHANRPMLPPLTLDVVLA
jgi:hypothetical protein